MKKAIRNIPKSRAPGRPSTGGRKQAIMVRLDDERVAAVEEWADAQGDKPSRPEAIRCLVELGLNGPKGKTK